MIQKGHKCHYLAMSYISGEKRDSTTDYPGSWDIGDIISGCAASIDILKGT